jgi:hypothetical protein
MIIKVNYTVSDIYMSTSVSPVYIKVVYSGTSGGGTWGTITGTLSSQTDLQAALDLKVPTSRTLTINGVSQDLSANRTYTIDALPSQTGNSGKYLTTNGTIASWGVIDLSAYVPYTGATGSVNLGANNFTANNVFTGFSTISASGTQVVLTINSVPEIQVTGSGGQTIKLPDATTLANGTTYRFNNNQSSGAILVNNNSNTLVASVPSGGYVDILLLSNSIAAGSWDRHDLAPANVSWSTNTFDYAGSITSATWNGNAVAVNRGGTGATTSSGALTNLGAQAALTLTTTGTSGAATLVGATLNIPQYSGGGGSMAIGGSITSATAGSVLFAGTSGVLQQNNANFFWDNTNNRLGIGTATPTNNIDILGTATTIGISIKNTSSSSGNTRSVIILENNLSYQSQIFKTNSAYSTYKTLSANDIGIYNGTGGGNMSFLNDFASGNINFAAGGSSTSHFTIASNGAITSSNSITISRNSNQPTQLIVSNTTSGSGSVSNLTITSDASSGSAIFGKYSSTTTPYKTIASSDAYVYNATAGDIGILNDYSSGKIKFASGGASTAQMTLTAAGRLLIGTTTESSYILDVNDKVRIKTNLEIKDTLVNAGSGTGLEINTNVSIPRVDFVVSGSYIGQISSTSTDFRLANNLTTTGGIIFDTQIASGTTATRMKLTNSGRLLLGTTTESTYIFDAVGTARISGALVINGSTGAVAGSIYSDATNGLVYLGKSGSVYDAAITNGALTIKIGIKNDQISMFGQVLAGGVKLGYGALSDGIYSDAAYGMVVVGKSSATIYASTFSAGNGNDGMFLTTNGKVNIGAFASTFSASALLDLVSTTRGFLPPRMTTTQKNAIASPAQGLMVFDTTLNKLCVYTTAWETITSL